MNKTDEYAPLRAAFANGARIQVWRLEELAKSSNDGKWITLTPRHKEPQFSCAPHLYRVHPEDLTILSSRQEVGAVADEYGWVEGPPHRILSKEEGEWFIAETTYGDRVVLKGLPEEYAYDFTTADSTYIKRELIKRWRQFPDSEYKPLGETSPAHTSEARDAARCYSIDGDSWHDCPDDAYFVGGRSVGDEFTLEESYWSRPVRFRVTKVPDGVNDDYEVERVDAAMRQEGGNG